MTWLWVLLALVILAAIFGFGGIIAVAAEIFQIIFWILLVLFVIGLIMGFVGRRRILA